MQNLHTAVLHFRSRAFPRIGSQLTPTILRRNFAYCLAFWRANGNLVGAKRFESARMPIDEMPLRVSEVLQNELPGRRLSKPTWSTTAAGLVVEVKRNRFVREAPDSFAYRSILFRVWESDQAAATGRFVEWMGPAISLVEEYVDAADMLSQEEYDASRIVSTYWGDGFSPFDYGTVVRFERLAISRKTNSSAVWDLIAQIVVREFSRRGSLLLLKAFPLEFENRLTKASPVAARSKFYARRRAMQRHYSHRLGVRSLPGEFGDDGWMWRPLRYCPAPERREN